ncbi:MAG: tetratricopeptide repeat protein [Candidatus Symbiothrix sp.]|jgi:tetratricopeptide (TPR) repeat protein|nr:tetratricopeptide repeat protein [Candidatus Symbiothrix sp.]
MAKKTHLSEQSTQVEKQVGEILSKTDVFVDQYLKKTIIAVVAVLAIIVGFIAVRHLYLIPRTSEAAAALFPAENHFAAQEWALALNGDSVGNLGLLDVIEEYGGLFGTPSANLAKYYAGICEFHLGDTETALKHLKSFSSKDQIVAAQAIGAIGDCEANLGNSASAVAHFKKAAEKANSSVISPIYLNKAAIASEDLGDYKKALEFYQTIKTKYPQSYEAQSVEKYIQRAKLKL